MDGHPLRPEIVRSKERSLPKGGSSLLSISVSSDSPMGLCWRCLSSFIGYYEVAQETELKFVHQNSPTVQLNTSLTQSQARNLKMANCDCTTFLLPPPPPNTSSFILISGSLYELFTSSRRIYLQFKNRELK